MTPKPRKPWLAALLTLLTVGLGHIYAGKAKRGVGFYFCLLGALLCYFGAPAIWIPAPANIILGFGLAFAYIIYVIRDAISVARSSGESYQLQVYNRWYVYLVVFIIANYVVQPAIKLFAMQAYAIPAASMAPTLEIGDHILVKKYAYGIRNPTTDACFLFCSTPRHKDVVVFIFPEDRTKDFVKRTIGASGDVVEVKDTQLILNGKALSEPYVSFDQTPGLTPPPNARKFGPTKVPEGKYFMLGDARDRSYDSRFWGMLDATDVRGHAYLIYWSWDREHGRVRWERIGKVIK